MRHFWKCWMLAIVLLFTVCQVTYGEVIEPPIAPTPVCYGYAATVPYATDADGWWNGVAFSNPDMTDNKVKLFIGHDLIGFNVPARTVVTKILPVNTTTFIEVYSCRPIVFQFFMGQGEGFDSTLFQTADRLYGD